MIHGISYLAVVAVVLPLHPALPGALSRLSRPGALAAGSGLPIGPFPGPIASGGASSLYPRVGNAPTPCQQHRLHSAQPVSHRVLRGAGRLGGSPRADRQFSELSPASREPGADASLH